MCPVVKFKYSIRQFIWIRHHLIIVNCFGPAQIEILKKWTHSLTTSQRDVGDINTRWAFQLVVWSIVKLMQLIYELFKVARLVVIVLLRYLT